MDFVETRRAIIRSLKAEGGSYDCLAAVQALQDWTTDTGRREALKRLPLILTDMRDRKEWGSYALAADVLSALGGTAMSYQVAQKYAELDAARAVLKAQLLATGTVAPVELIGLPELEEVGAAQVWTTRLESARETILAAHADERDGGREAAQRASMAVISAILAGLAEVERTVTGDVARAA